MTFEPWEWGLAIGGAILVGISKTGFAGLGMLFVVLFAQVMPAKQATGIVLPLLCFGDIFAVLAYRQHANWAHLWRLFPWTAAGIGLGYFTLGRIDDREARIMIGTIVLTLVTMHLIRRRRGGHEAEHGTWFAPMVGVLAGFTTMVANAAGPLMAVYLLAMRLPKMEYVGTAAVFFLIINLFKVPFMVHLDLITAASFAFNLKLAPAVIGGALIGRKLLARVNQRWFENIVLALAVLAGLKLLI